jgi:hypothetical protein
VTKRVGVARLGEAQPLLHDADHHAADYVDQQNQQAGDRVATHEFRGAVHGAEEAGFVFQILAPAPRFLLVDQAGGKVGVDRHLLARHGIEVEAGCHFGDASGALGDDHEIDDHQDGEDDDADDEIPGHDEIAERLDHMAGGVGPLVAARQDEAGRGEIEREPQHGRYQQHGRKGGKFQRRLDEQGRHQDQHREGDRDGEREVEQKRRQRQNEDDENGHHADGQAKVAPLEQRPEIGKARKRQPSVATVGRSYNVGHAACLRPSIAVTCCEAMRGGCGATGTNERKRRRARVQDCP